MSSNPNRDSYHSTNSSSDPFRTPSQRSNSVATSSDIDPEAIGIALTADGRRSPSVSYNHSASGSVSSISYSVPSVSARENNNNGRHERRRSVDGHATDTTPHATIAASAIPVSSSETPLTTPRATVRLVPGTPSRSQISRPRSASLEAAPYTPRRAYVQEEVGTPSQGLLGGMTPTATPSRSDSLDSSESNTSFNLQSPSRRPSVAGSTSTGKGKRGPPVSLHQHGHGRISRARDSVAGWGYERRGSAAPFGERWPGAAPTFGNPEITVNSPTPDAPQDPQTPQRGQDQDKGKGKEPSTETQEHSRGGSTATTSSTHYASSLLTASDATTPRRKPKPKGTHVSFSDASVPNSTKSRVSFADDLDHTPIKQPGKAVLRNPFDDSFAGGIDTPRVSFSHEGSRSAFEDSDVEAGRPGKLRKQSRTGSWFGGGRRKSRQLSEVGPLDTAHSRSGSISTALDGSATPGSSRRPSLAISGSELSPEGKRGQARSKSMWEALPSFRNPFAHPSDREANLTGSTRRPSIYRRHSEPAAGGAAAAGPRRPSTMRRMSSVVLPEPNPIPKRYRTHSVSSFAFYVNKMGKNNTEIPIFAEDVATQKENLAEFLDGVQKLQLRSKRPPWVSRLFRFGYFFVVLCIIYFVFVGQPLWTGVGLTFYRWIHSNGIAEGGVAIFMSWAAFQAFVPMLGTRFEQEVDDVEKRDASETALLIPAYKAALILPETIKYALKIFKPEQIFVVANGNADTYQDDTLEQCKPFGVNVTWVPIGSKITAEFVGVALARKYKYVMLIDDDVHLPANIPLVTDRINETTKCIGYTIKSTGANGSKGTIIQQCQDMEYKLSGLTRTFCGKYGSATFPHGAIILWERETLQALFNIHPGYIISEDWFFGYACRASGHRIEFCSQVFVETETPPALFKDFGPSRGGYGEMTVFKQRFTRWNFFFAFRLWTNSVYMLLSWRLGWREIVTKIWVFVELYDCVMAFLRPWVVVLMMIANYRLVLIFMAALMGMYMLAFTLFNSWHLRKKNEMISWKVLPFYFMMKFTLLWVNVASVYWDVYLYARYFSVKHPRVIESRQVLEAAYRARLGPEGEQIEGAEEKAEKFATGKNVPVGGVAAHGQVSADSPSGSGSEELNEKNAEPYGGEILQDPDGIFAMKAANVGLLFGNVDNIFADRPAVGRRRSMDDADLDEPPVAGPSAK